MCFSRDDLTWIKEGAYVISLNEKKGKKHIGFDTFEIEFTLQEVLKKGKRITHNIFRMQSDDPIMCGFYFLTFIEYMIARKILLDYSNLFSTNGCKKNDKIIFKYFKDNDGKRKRKPWLSI